jgi:hypothetical protein
LLAGIQGLVCQERVLDYVFETMLDHRARLLLCGLQTYGS